MIPPGVEHTQLARVIVRHDDSPIGQFAGAECPVEHVRSFAFQPTDRNRRLGPDPPREPRTLGRAGVLDDPDAGAVALLFGPQSFVRRTVGLARHCAHGDEGQDNEALHELVT